jgi:protein-tyrosine phosphatase
VTAAGPVEGAFNFRDLGGLRAGTDRVVRSGVLLRSDTLQVLSARDVAYLVDEVGLEIVVDLRIGPEAVEHGRGPLAGMSVCYLNAPLHEAPVSDLPPRDQSLALYLDHAGSPQSKVGTVVRIVCALAGRPVLVHCAMGKDRTGLVIALLLRLLGVDDAEIVADYLRTSAAVPRIVERFRSWPHYAEHMASVPSEVYDIDERTITGFLSWLDTAHGGAVGWARARGIADADIARLRAGMLVPSVP